MMIEKRLGQLEQELAAIEKRVEELERTHFTLAQGTLHPPLGIQTNPDPWPYFPQPTLTRK